MDEYWDLEDYSLIKESSDKSFAYGIGLTHDRIESGDSYSSIRSFLKNEKNFSDATIDQIFEMVKKTRRDRADGDIEENDKFKSDEFQLDSVSPVTVDVPFVVNVPLL